MKYKKFKIEKIIRIIIKIISIMNFYSITIIIISNKFIHNHKSYK
jgi:hypothetical protein